MMASTSVKVEVAAIEPVKDVFGGGAQAVVALGDGLGERGGGAGCFTVHWDRSDLVAVSIVIVA